jgi:hypothetical protein
MTDRTCEDCKWFGAGLCQRSEFPSNQPKVTKDHFCGQWEEVKIKSIDQEFLFDNIIKVLKKYLDLKEEYYPLIATWIIGTYMHKSFYSYPYLFFNAMKGSGKTRTLNLILCLANKGLLLGSISEASLFRTSNDTTMGIDEFEEVGKDDNQALRELLNAAYKKGLKVPRVKEVRKINEETGKSEKSYEVELLEVYRPILMANIWGMDEVLGDRSITLTLEKSSKQNITNKIEIFDLDDEILALKQDLVQFSVVSVDVVSPGGQTNHISLLKAWNLYIDNIYTTLNYITTLDTLNTIKLHLFNKIRESGISARNLELSFPLIIVAEMFGKETEVIAILKQIMEDKKEDELFESKDTRVFDFISTKETADFLSVKQLTNEFRNFIEATMDDLDWCNTKWFGRALKRLCLVKDKRRIGEGVMVKLDIEKAREKLKMFGK